MQGLNIFGNHLSGKAPANEADERLKAIKEDLADTQPIGSILNLCKTYDQGNALLKFIDIITEKKFRTTVSLTAARGRGKSAALGLSIAAALAYGYANIFVTSPSPDNLGTLFEFVLKGLDALKYDQNSDYDIIQSTQDDMKKAIVRINLMRDHRQTVQYIDPSDHKMLAQAELVVIDEAAAIPLPLVKNLLGPYLVFMSSTVNGYEGTGRSLSLKLLDNLRRQADTSGSAVGQRSLAELTLDESIRYAPNCPVEAWLNSLLCLDCEIPRATFSLPSPSSCSLYWVNRDALFSGNKSSEKFLSSLMALYVASHYKNQPNDLQLLSDAPAHHLFVLCAPVSTTQTSLPTPLVVIQVAHEGKIAKESIKHSLREGRKASGDLIPWTVSEQFRQLDFGELSGARIVRIATHPDFQRAGYGKEALRQMQEYYAGKVPLADNLPDIEAEGVDELNEDVDLLQEKIQPKKELAIMYGLDQRRAERLDWLGVSFGLTSDLLRFWTRSGYRAVYMRQNANDTTGEHSTVFLKSIHGSGTYLRGFQDDFSRRFASLLGFEFRKFSPAVALQILETSRKSSSQDSNSLRLLKTYFTSYDLERMELYGKGVVDYHLIVDILPQMVKMIFTGEINIKGLSVQQKAILVALGLQYKSVDELAEISLTSQLPPMPASQILGHFKRAIIRINEEVKRLETKKAEAELDLPKSKTDLQIEEGEEGAIDAVLDEEAAKIKEEQAKEKQELVKALQQYKIKGNDTDWSQELSTRKSVANISIGRERVDEKKSENEDVPVKRKGGKTPEGKKKKKKHG